MKALIVGTICIIVAFYIGYFLGKKDKKGTYSCYKRECKKCFMRFICGTLDKLIHIEGYDCNKHKDYFRKSRLSDN